MTPRNFTFAATLYDGLGGVVGSAALTASNAPSGGSGPYNVHITVPAWAYVSVGTVYKDMFTRSLWQCGTCWGPETSENVIVVTNRGTSPVKIPGDVNGDFKVDVLDLSMLLSACGGKADGSGRRSYNPNCDINGDGKIDVFDLSILLCHFGQHYP